MWTVKRACCQAEVEEWFMAIGMLLRGLVVSCMGFLEGSSLSQRICYTQINQCVTLIIGTRCAQGEQEETTMHGGVN